jgi:6-bladed beta-propeller protein
MTTRMIARPSTRMMPCLLILSLMTLLAAPAVGDNVPTIRNSAEPTDGRHTLDMKELWRSGGDTGDVMFGDITEIVTDADGRVYILDSQFLHVKVFDAQGNHVGELSREGEGPGEIRQPSDLVRLDDRGIGIALGFPGRMICLADNGDPLDNLYPNGTADNGGLGIITGLQYRDDHMLLICSDLEPVPATGHMIRHRRLRLTDGQGLNPRDVLTLDSQINLGVVEYHEAEEYFLGEAWALGPKGTAFAAADRDQYLISVFEPSGKLIRKIGRDYQPRRRSEAEKSLPDTDLRANGGDTQVREICDTDPCIFSLHVDPQGALWALPPQGSLDVPDEVLEMWDVFDTDGRFVRQAVIPRPAGVEHGRTFFLDDTHLVIARGLVGPGVVVDESAEIEVPEIICYEFH